MGFKRDRKGGMKMAENDYQRILTEEETLEHFLYSIKQLIDYWENEERQLSIRKKLESLAFSILVLIDGEAGDHPPCILKPLVSSPDGNKWLDIGYNISGKLHDNFFKKIGEGGHQ